MPWRARYEPCAETPDVRRTEAIGARDGGPWDVDVRSIASMTRTSSAPAAGLPAFGAHRRSDRPGAERTSSALHATRRTRTQMSTAKETRPRAPEAMGITAGLRVGCFHARFPSR